MAQQKMTPPREEIPSLQLCGTLGLKLESQKAVLEMLVIDHAEKVPSGD